MSQYEQDQTAKRMKQFEDQYNMLQRHLDDFSDPQPWLRFTMVHITDTETIQNLLIDTFTSTATVYRYGDSKTTVVPIMLTNFEYKKNGAGKANSFSLSFAFNPADKTGNGGVIDPSIIDKALVVNSYFTAGADTDTFKAIETIAKHRCYMQYGYNFGNDQMLSPEYFGQALNAKSELRDGLLYYTITGYSSLTYLTDFPVPSSVIKAHGKKTGDGIGDVEYGWKTSDAMKYAIELYFDPEYRDTNNPNFNKLYKGMEVKITNEVPKEEDIEVYIEEASGNESLMQYLDRVAKGANLKRNQDRKDETKKATIAWKIIEQDNVLEFVIYLVDPKEDEVVNQELLDSRVVNVVFEYPTEKNNIVRSFTPDFKFETIWTRDIFLSSDEIDVNSYFLDKHGNVKAIKDMQITDIYTGNKEKIEATAIAEFSEAMQYRYNANMTTEGIPSDVPIGTVIYVCPIINGKKYHYAGYYMVKSTVDRIDTNGYTSEFELFKLSAERTIKIQQELVEQKAEEVKSEYAAKVEKEKQEKTDFVNAYNKKNGTYFTESAFKKLNGEYQLQDYAKMAGGDLGKSVVPGYTNITVINEEGLKYSRQNSDFLKQVVFTNGKPEKVNKANNKFQTNPYR